jgi:hypothetical protein
VASHPSERHAPLDRVAVRSLHDAVQLQHVRTRRNLQMRRHHSGGVDKGDALRGTSERQAVTLGKLDDVWNVTTLSCLPAGAWCERQASEVVLTYSFKDWAGRCRRCAPT